MKKLNDELLQLNKTELQLEKQGDNESKVTTVHHKEDKPVHSTPIVNQTSPPKLPQFFNRPAWEPSAVQDQTASSMNVTEAVTAVLEQSRQQNKSLIETLQLPKIALPQFNGDSMEYYPFMKRFSNIMQGQSDSTKLNTLIQHCVGRASEVIRCCEYRESSEGYTLAISF